MARIEERPTPEVRGGERTGHGGGARNPSDPVALHGGAFSRQPCPHLRLAACFPSHEPLNPPDSMTGSLGVA